MIQSEMMRFSCPACRTVLSVPISLAGVTAPCPACKTIIQAPHLQPTTIAAPPLPAPFAETNTALADLPSSSNLAPPPTKYRPIEPRQLPSRQASPQVAAQPAAHTSAGKVPVAQRRLKPEPSGTAHMRRVSKSSQKRRPWRRLATRILIPLLVLSAAVGVAYGVMTFLKQANKTEIAASKRWLNHSQAEAKVQPRDGSTSSLSAAEQSQDEPREVATAAVPEAVTALEKDLDVPTESEPKDAGQAALQHLEAFLASTTLEERLPMIETQHSPEELASTVLAQPFPSVLNIAVDIRQNRPNDSAVDHYYQVDFATPDGRKDPQLLLVRQRGPERFLVLADPLLDLFGGRFADYASKVQSEARTFYLVVSAGAYTNEDIPSKEKKYTLRILTREDSKEIARAYFGRQSRIGQMLADPTSGISYGQTMPVTVFMRWNDEEDPERPFLEALDIKSLNWDR